MKKVTINQERVTAPTAFVTKGRQRVKQYDGNIVYLKNGDEFEIELFNPTSQKVLAKINVNGKSLDSGIVLRPGERVFLERYLDEAKRFLFETYEVDAKDPNVQEAIKNNGVVDVEFYDEYRQPYIINYPSTYHYHYYYEPYRYPYHYISTPITTIYTCDSGSSIKIGGMTNPTYSCDSVSYNSNISSAECKSYQNNTLSSSVQETGMISKGSYSDQHFTYDSTSFNSYCTWKTAWKILPESQKVYSREDLVVYCSSCGCKRKKSSHRFCPNCGTRF